MMTERVAEVAHNEARAVYLVPPRMHPFFSLTPVHPLYINPLQLFSLFLRLQYLASEMSSSDPSTNGVRNLSTGWQVAPALYEIQHGDKHKIKYRKEVDERINSLPLKFVKKLPIIIISTNVMCADIRSSQSDNPDEKDLYLPLEICLTKSCVSEANKEKSERVVKVAHWIINPGRPPATTVNDARDHVEQHKIEYEKFRPNDPFVETDLRKIVKEINAFLTPERMVFSRELRHCRQDLGSLKWLSDQVKKNNGLTMKPIKLFSLEDLYVVMLRRLYPQHDGTVCLGMAQMNFMRADYHDTNVQCSYHKARFIEDDATTTNCAMGVATCLMHVLLDEASKAMQMQEDIDAENVGRPSSRI